LPKKESDSRPFSPPIELKYLSTSSREGQQIAHLTREALNKIGIKVNIHIYEPSLFYAKIKKREFDLFSSTSVPGTTNILDLPHTELIPLFRWKHGLILNSRIKIPDQLDSYLDYSFRFLSRLHLQSSS
jgi:ABC-type transport system substrate-binding protein